MRTGSWVSRCKRAGEHAEGSWYSSCFRDVVLCIKLSKFVEIMTYNKRVFVNKYLQYLWRMPQQILFSWQFPNRMFHEILSFLGTRWLQVSKVHITMAQTILSRGWTMRPPAANGRCQRQWHPIPMTSESSEPLRVLDLCSMGGVVPNVSDALHLLQSLLHHRKASSRGGLAVTFPYIFL